MLNELQVICVLTAMGECMQCIGAAFAVSTWLSVTLMCCAHHVTFTRLYRSHSSFPTSAMNPIAPGDPSH